MKKELPIQKMNSSILTASSLTKWYNMQIKYPKSNANSNTYEAIFGTTSVYIMFNWSTMLYKIGITQNALIRRGQLAAQSGCPIELVIYIELNRYRDESARDCERLLHQFFSDKRKQGEWFDLDVRGVLALKSLFYSIGGEMIGDKVKEHFLFRKQKGHFNLLHTTQAL
jgi:hypothetical protein